MTDAELVRDALDEFMPCYGSEESAKRKREVLAAFDGIVARVAELEEGIKELEEGIKAAIREAVASEPRRGGGRTIGITGATASRDFKEPIGRRL